MLTVPTSNPCPKTDFQIFVLNNVETIREITIPHEAMKIGCFGMYRLLFLKADRK